MSIKLMTIIWDHSKQEGTTLLMLLAIADHANDEGICWPSKRTLAKKCRVSERHAGRLIKKLVDDKEIEIERGGGRGHANVYKVTPVTGFIDETAPSYRVTPESPFIEKKDPPLSKKGDSQGKTLTPETAKGDIAESCQSLEPSLKQPSINHKGDRPPSVDLCKRIIYRFPHKSLWKTLDRSIGRDFISLLRWGRLLRHWKLQGWNPTNFKGMLDAFSRNDKDNPDSYDSEIARQAMDKSWAKAQD